MKKTKKKKGFFYKIGHFFDKKIITPTTRLIVKFTDKFGGSEKSLEGWLSKTNTLLFVSLILALIVFIVIDQKIIVFTNKTAEELEETLILNDVDVLEVSVEDGKAEVLVTDEAFENAKKVLNDNGINDFDVAEVRFIPNEKITLEGEDLKKFNDLLDSLDDCEDVQAVYHNVER